MSLDVFWLAGCAGGALGVGVPGKPSWTGAGSGGRPGHRPGVCRTRVRAKGAPDGAGGGAGERSCSFSTSAHLCTPACTPVRPAAAGARVRPPAAPGAAGALARAGLFQQPQGRGDAFSLTEGPLSSRRRDPPSRPGAAEGVAALPIPATGSWPSSGAVAHGVSPGPQGEQRETQRRALRGLL